MVLCAVLAAGACAHQPAENSPRLIAQAARYGVSPRLLRAAENRGFWPQMQDGRAQFCRASEVVGSEIAARECVDPAQLQARLAREEDEAARSRAALERGSGGCPPDPSAGC